MRPMVTYDNFLRAKIDEFHNDFARIWARDACDRSTFDLWLHVVDHTSRIARAVRRQDPPAVVDDVADTTVWLMSFIAQCQSTQPAATEACFKFEQQPSEIIWQKYPGMCPGCLDAWAIKELRFGEGELPLR